MKRKLIIWHLMPAYDMDVKSYGVIGVCALDTISAVNDAAGVARLLRLYKASTELWQLSAREHAALLDVPSATWSRMKNGSYRGRLSQDKVTRIAGVTAINNAIGEACLPPNWISCYISEPGYDGGTPLKKMLDGGILGIKFVLIELQKAASHQDTNSDIPGLERHAKRAQG